MTYFPKPPTIADGTILATGPRLPDRSVLQSTGEHPAPCARHCEANAFRIELRNKDARIAEENKRIVDLLEDVALRNTRIAELEAELASALNVAQWFRKAEAARLAAEARIAELEKQAAIDKALLALADARINRELRDDFAGRAMQGLLARPGGGYTPTMAYAMADEMLKAKGGA